MNSQRLKHYMPRMDPVRAITATATTLGLCFGLVAILSASGCCGQGVIRAEAVDGTMRRLIERHDRYTHADSTLTPLQRRANLRDGAVVINLLDEAKAQAAPVTSK